MIRLTQAEYLIANLRQTLAPLPAGPIGWPERFRVADALRDSWFAITGLGGEGSSMVMDISPQDLNWESPNLQFTLERSGRPLKRNAPVALDRWEVNVDRGIATVRTDAHLLKGPIISPPFKKSAARALALELAGIIASGEEDGRLERFPNGDGRVKLDDCVEADHKRTRTVRNERILAELVPLLERDGWEVYSDQSLCWFYRPKAEPVGSDVARAI